jgi:hypothetical protein
MKSVNDSKIRFTLVTILGHPDHFQAGWVFFEPFRRQKPPRTHLSRSGCIFLIPASNVTQTTFRPVGLTIFHSGVKGHPDHFWAAQLYLSHSGVERHIDYFWSGRAKTKKQKKFRRLLEFETMPL